MDLVPGACTPFNIPTCKNSMQKSAFVSELAPIVVTMENQKPYLEGGAAASLFPFRLQPKRGIQEGYSLGGLEHSNVEWWSAIGL